MLALIPCSAWAHHAEFMQDRPFLQGLSMPVHGIDHLLAALAAGALATRLASRQARMLVISLGSAGVLAGLLNVNGIALPEWTLCALLAGVGALLMIQPERRSSAVLAGMIGTLFAANAVELTELFPSQSGALPWFAAGCTLAIIALINAGFLAGIVLQRFHKHAEMCFGIALLATSGLLTLFPAANELLIRWVENM